jgi:hypothetical protein
MRTAKSLWSFTGLLGLIVGVAVISSEAPVMAQLPPPNPLVAPLAPSGGPAQLAAPVQAQGVPSLVAVPTIPAASPTPGARAFNCSCSGPGEGTRWMGQVSAPGYFAARQSAAGACLGYNQLKEPAPASVAAADGATSVVPPSFANPDAAAAVGATLPGGLSVSSAAQRQACAQCVCD